MANTITGKVAQIGNTQEFQSKSGKTYMRRDLVLDATKFDPYTGERGVENYPVFEFGGENCKILDTLLLDQIVTVSFDLQGTRYEKDGEDRYFTRIRGYKVEVRPERNNKPTPAYPQQPAQQSYQVAPGMPPYPGTNPYPNQAPARDPRYATNTQLVFPPQVPDDLPY